jgi:hypothetical protein
MRWLVSFMAWALTASMPHIVPASAQEPGRIYRVGWLQIGRPGLVIAPMEKWTGSVGVHLRDTLRNNGLSSART